MKDILTTSQKVPIIWAINAIFKQKGRADEEIISLGLGKVKMRFKCTTQETWEETHKKANKAMLLFGNTLNGYPAPDAVLEDEEVKWKYYITFIK